MVIKVIPENGPTYLISNITTIEMETDDDKKCTGDFHFTHGTSDKSKISLGDKGVAYVMNESGDTISVIRKGTK